MANSSTNLTVTLTFVVTNPDGTQNYSSGHSWSGMDALSVNAMKQVATTALDTLVKMEGSAHAPK